MESDDEPLLTQISPISDGKEAPLSELSRSKKTISLLQTAFNISNVIMGVSLLTLPFAFKKSGWIFGFFLLALFGFVANVSAKILAACQRYYHNITGIRLLTYGDIGEAAFGTYGRVFIQTVFMFELFSATVALFLLISHSINLLMPDSGDLTFIRIGIWAFLTVLTWPKSPKVLSYGSVIGIICLFNLIGVVFYDGFYKETAPGSLWEPAPTSLFPSNWLRVPGSFGILMAGYAGHACFPGFYSSMKNPAGFSRAADIAFIAGLIAYASIASAGYLMFGEGVGQMITDNLKDPVYPATLFLITMSLMVINPSTKYPLTMYPILMDLEHWFFGGTVVRPIASIPVSPQQSPFEFPVSDEVQLLNSDTVRIEESFLVRLYHSKTARRILFRTFMSSLVLATALLFNHFDRVIGVLGSLFSTTTSIIFPLACYLSFFKAKVSHTFGAVNVRASRIAWMNELDPRDREYAPVWKRTLAKVTIAIFIAFSIVGTVWNFLPEKLIPI